VFRYKLFSDDKTEWLPRTPKDNSEGRIAIGNHSAVGGLKNFIAELSGEDREITLAEAAASNTQPRVHMAMQVLCKDKIRHGLNQIDVTATNQFMARLDAQADGKDAVTAEYSSQFNTKETEAYFKEVSTVSAGKYWCESNTN
jgi:hypothetical protein